MVKTRVGVVLREKIGSNKATSKSADLVSLIERYHVWSKRIRSMIMALEKHQQSMIQMEQTRTLVAKQIATMSQGSPLWPASGLMPGSDKPANSVCSIASINDALSTKSKTYSTKYKQFVIDYAVEWEKVVRTRVDAGIKKAEELRRDLDHYQKKVEELRNTTNRTITKGKQIKPETQEKLKRNEEKLLSAKETYSKVSHDLCILIEEVTERSWRDLHPLLVKIGQFDMTLAQDEAQILASMNQVVAKLKEIADAQGISAQPRLKDVAEKKPEELSTRPGGVDSAPSLSIESHLSPTSALSNSPMGGADDMAQPPGTVAPQGIGGFPVQVADSGPRASPTGDGAFQHRNSFSSQHSEPPNTLGLLTIGSNAAPAPTLDDVYSSQEYVTGDNTSVVSGGPARSPQGGDLPPLGGPPSYHRAGSMGGGGGATYSRSNSMGAGAGDDVSVYSQLSAGSGLQHPPPPSMPPPPPPPSGPPPPAPSSGGYIVPTVTPTAYDVGPYGVPPSPVYPPPAPPSGDTNPFGPPPSQPPPPPADTNPFGPPPSQPPPPPPAGFNASGGNPNNPFG